MTRRFPGRAWHPNAYPHVPFTIDRDSPQAQGIVAWWPTLGSAGANVLRDFGGRGFTGTFNGTLAWQVDNMMGAVPNYDGATTYVTTNKALIPLTGNFTITQWFSSTNTVTNAHLVTQYEAVIPTASGRFLTEVNRVSQKYGCFHGSGAGVITSAASFSTAGPNLMVIRRAGNTFSLFLNGVQDASTGSSDVGIQDTATWIGVGRGIPNFGYFPGQIGDIRIYNRALSAAEVWQQWAPESRFDLYRPLLRRLWTVPSVAGWAFNPVWDGRGVIGSSVITGVRP